MHTKEMLETYGLGLGALSTTGREHKHQKINEYYHHTAGLPDTDKWISVFCHE